MLSSRILFVVPLVLVALILSSIPVRAVDTYGETHCPSAATYDSLHVYYPDAAKLRGGEYASMAWPVIGGLQYLQTGLFEPGVTNVTSYGPAPDMPGTGSPPLNWWPLQTFPPDNATINWVHIYAVVNGNLGRNFQLGFSDDNRASFTWSSNVYVGGSTWQSSSWNVTTQIDYFPAWTPMILRSIYVWAAIRSYDANPWTLDIDYIGVRYNWTVPGGGGGGPGSGEDELALAETFHFGFGLTGVALMIASPAVAIWHNHAKGGRIMSFLLFMIIGVTGLAFFLAGSG